MARRNNIPGSYEIWQERPGLESQFVISLYSNRDVKNFLLYRADEERLYGLKIRENDGGGFTAYTRRRDPATKKMVMYPVIHYWFETVMADIHPKLDVAIQDKIAEAMIMGGLKGKAMREAVASGIEFEEDEDE